MMLFLGLCSTMVGLIINTQKIMAKRKTSVSPKKFTRHPHKTAKRLVAKRAMLAGKAGKKVKARAK